MVRRHPRAVNESFRTVPVPSETLHAFDLHARGYVASWGSDPLAQWMRARVLALCAKFFPASSRVLDLGCGPGLDAAALTALGHQRDALHLGRDDAETMELLASLLRRQGKADLAAALT